MASGMSTALVRYRCIRTLAIHICAWQEFKERGAAEYNAKNYRGAVDLFSQVRDCCGRAFHECTYTYMWYTSPACVAKMCRMQAPIRLCTGDSTGEVCCRTEGPLFESECSVLPVRGVHTPTRTRLHTFHRLSNFSKAIEDADKCLEIDENWAKGYSRKGKALLDSGRYAEAYNMYQRGMRRSLSRT
jgi:tetratricopeptide (TPR) repeat protein